MVDVASLLRGLLHAYKWGLVFITGTRCYNPNSLHALGAWPVVGPCKKGWEGLQNTHIHVALCPHV